MVVGTAQATPGPARGVLHTPPPADFALGNVDPISPNPGKALFPKEVKVSENEVVRIRAIRVLKNEGDVSKCSQLQVIGQPVRMADKLQPLE